MRNRLSLGVAVVALVISVFGATPLGRAAISNAVPLAKHAYLADTAKNAVRVGNIKASRTPTAGMLVPLGANGRFPASVGAAGPAGPQGAKGPAGAQGVKGDPGQAGVLGYEIHTVAATLNGPSNFSTSVSCTAGQKVVGGGISGTAAKVTLAASYPESDRVWAVGGTATASTSVTVYAICVTVA
jgi:hypothetical protein